MVREPDRQYMVLRLTYPGGHLTHSLLAVPHVLLNNDAIGTGRRATYHQHGRA